MGEGPVQSLLLCTPEKKALRGGLRDPLWFTHHTLNKQGLQYRFFAWGGGVELYLFFVCLQMLFDFFCSLISQTSFLSHNLEEVFLVECIQWPDSFLRHQADERHEVIRNYPEWPPLLSLLKDVTINSMTLSFFSCGYSKGERAPAIEKLLGRTKDPTWDIFSPWVHYKPKEGDDLFRGVNHTSFLLRFFFCFHPQGTFYK